MTDLSSGGAAGAAPGSDAQPLGMGPIVVNMQYIKDLSFENPNAPQSMMPSDTLPTVEVNVNVGAREVGPGGYEVTLSLNTTAKRAEAVAFIVEIAYVGLFTLSGIPEEHVQPVLMIECPRIMFPFVRAILADVTRDGGFAPLMLQPIDFVELYRRRVGEGQAGTATA